MRRSSQETFIWRVSRLGVPRHLFWKVAGFAFPLRPEAFIFGRDARFQAYPDLKLPRYGLSTEIASLVAVQSRQYDSFWRIFYGIFSDRHRRFTLLTESCSSDGLRPQKSCCCRALALPASWDIQPGASGSGAPTVDIIDPYQSLDKVDTSAEDCIVVVSYPQMEERWKPKLVSASQPAANGDERSSTPDARRVNLP